MRNKCIITETSLSLMLAQCYSFAQWVIVTVNLILNQMCQVDSILSTSHQLCRSWLGILLK